MNEREALEQGYEFTGMCWSTYDELYWRHEQYKAKAKKLKRLIRVQITL